MKKQKVIGRRKEERSAGGRGKVLLAMSGGVDSSVAALILKKQGYEVVGAFMKNWSDTKNEFGECAWRDERKFAIKIASQLNIPLITLDFEKKYRKEVIDEMFKKYKKGITPNPDIDCNQKIKFPLLLKEAKKRGFDLIATGHYARIKKVSARSARGRAGGNMKYDLLRGKDESKDQSYFLYRISEKELKNILFPIGDYSKTQIREIAQENNFPNADKKGTVGICFVGKVNLKDFLKKKIKPKKGKILDPEGKVIGEHDGIFYYTVGQRLGPRYGFEVQRGKGEMKKWYVAKKDAKKNIIIAAPEGHKINYRSELTLKDFHLISENKKEFLKEPRRILSRIRQVGELLPSQIYKEKGKIKVVLDKPITGVSEGQALVFYQKDKCLGGGVISF